MVSLRKRIKTLERSQSVRAGAATDQIVRRVQGRVSDCGIGLPGSAVSALVQCHDLTPAECDRSMRLRSGSGIRKRKISRNPCQTALFEMVGSATPRGGLTS